MRKLPVVSSMTLTRQGFFCWLKQAINLTGMGRAVRGSLSGLLFFHPRIGLVLMRQWGLGPVPWRGSNP
jgi:hypothetical protein